jgi:hypothetical protein
MSGGTSHLKGKHRVQIKVTDAETGAEVSSSEEIIAGTIVRGWCCSSCSCDPVVTPVRESATAR